MTKTCAKCGRSYEATQLFSDYCPSCYWISIGKPRGPGPKEVMGASCGAAIGTLIFQAILGILALVGMGLLVGLSQCS